MLIPLLLATVLSSPAPAGDRTPGAEATLRLEIGHYEVRGDAKAPVLVVEFSDFKCHACERFNLTIMPNLEKEFIGPGKVKVVFVDFPLVDEDHYTTVAESVHCAGRQGKYWPMHDLIWEKVGALGDEHLLTYAGGLGLEQAVFRQCLAEDRFRPRVLEDLRFANSLGLSARPTFFIGRSQPDGSYKGRYIEGTHNYVLFKSVIQRALAQGAGR